MPGEHLLEQRALDENCAAQVKYGVPKHLGDRFALSFTHPVLLVCLGPQLLSSIAARRMRCRRIMYAISMLLPAQAAPAVPGRGRRSGPEITYVAP
jgi:hypothetical protein